MLEGLRGDPRERRVRPRVAADIHAGIDDRAQGLLRIGIVLELGGIHETVRATEMMGIQLGGQPGDDACACFAGRKIASGG